MKKIFIDCINVLDFSWRVLLYILGAIAILFILKDSDGKNLIEIISSIKLVLQWIAFIILEITWAFIVDKTIFR